MRTGSGDATLVGLPDAAIRGYRLWSPRLFVWGSQRPILICVDTKHVEKTRVPCIVDATRMRVTALEIAP